MGDKVAGFGLLEAIVALAIFAGVGMALFAWINANLGRAAELAAREEETRALLLALDWVETINPAVRPTGEVTLDDGARLAWQSVPSAPRAQVAPLPGGERTPFELARFTLSVAITFPDRAEAYRFTLERLGVWREPFAWEEL